MENKILYSLSAERSVLGGVILDADQWESVSGVLVADDFFRPEHQAVFMAMQSLCDQSEPIDAVTVSERLKRNGELDDVGGVEYLFELADTTPSPKNAPQYAEIVKEQSVLRGLVKASQKSIESAFNPTGLTPLNLIENAERELTELSEAGNTKGGFRDTLDVLKSVVSEVEELQSRGGGISGISTGLDDLDEMTSGLQNKDLIILAGRPSSGKTSCALNIAENVAIETKKPVLVFSLEMPAEQLLKRSIASLGRLDHKHLKNGDMDSEHWNKVMLATKILKDSKIMIDDTSGISPSELRSKASKVKREHGEIGLIVVDYLQLMKINGFTEGRTQEISEISRSLKAIAKEMDCPVIALSQLNRSLENRPDKRPINSDLRESGAIEQDADVIMFVYRDEVYHPDTDQKGIAELIIGKQRNGPIGTCKTAFIGRYTRFENLSPAHYRNEY